MPPSTAFRKLGLAMALASVSLAMMSGCATGVPQTKPIAAYVPPDSKAQLQSDPDQASLTFFRISGVMGQLIDYVLLVDGVEVARIASGKIVRLPITEGPHVVEVRHPSSLFGAPGETLQIRTTKGQGMIFEVVSGIGRIRLMEAEVIPFSVSGGS